MHWDGWCARQRLVDLIKGAVSAKSTLYVSTRKSKLGSLASSKGNFEDAFYRERKAACFLVGSVSTVTERLCPWATATLAIAFQSP